MFQTLGLAHSLIGEFDEALKQFNKSIQLSPAGIPEKGSIYFLIADTYAKLSKQQSDEVKKKKLYAEAKKIFEETVSQFNEGKIPANLKAYAELPIMTQD